MKKPCIECPFKKNSLPGYLGNMSYQPIEYLQHLNAIEPVECHLTVDYNSDDHSNSKPCLGALQFMNNSGKLTRYYGSQQREAGKNKDVFSTTVEFIEHHKKEVEV